MSGKSQGILKWMKSGNPAVLAEFCHNYVIKLTAH